MKHTVCRVCHANCGLMVEVENNVVLKIHGDKTNPAYQGFSCIKGREMGRYHADPARLLHSQARQPDGSFAPVEAGRAMDAIAGRLAEVADRHGPAAIACYSGTHAYQNPTSARFLRAFMAAIGSPMFFDTTTIDQPGKTIARTVHGVWSAGGYHCVDADAWLLIGTNPLASMQGGFSVNPAANLHQAQARGLTLVVVDPRVSDVARKAALHIQPRPGSSATILAGIIREVCARSRYDREFVAAHVAGFDRLRATVEPFTPALVARIADVPEHAIIDAARIYGGARRAGINVGTGPNMSGHCSVVEYLALSLMTICGHWRRAGEPVLNPGVLVHPMPAVAEAIAGRSALRPGGRQMRVRGLSETAGGLPTAALADEILLDGPERIRALLVVGGNPMMAIPDQIKTRAAMQKLDLLVCVDPILTATARMSDFVIAPRLSMETITCSAGYELLGAFGAGWGYVAPYGQYAPPVLDPPAGSDLLEDWQLFYGLAQRLGLTLRIPDAAHLPPLNQQYGFDLDMTDPPTSEQLYERMFAGAPVPLADMRAQSGGRLFERAATVVQPGTSEARLEVGDPDLMAELAGIANEPAAATRPYRLISRRLTSSHNSSWHDAPNLAKREPYNTAYMNPADLDTIGLSAGGRIEIRSDRAAVIAIAAPDAGVRRGAVSISHCWGDVEGMDDDPTAFGASVARLIFNDRDFDPLTGLPRMSNLAVSIAPLNEPEDAAADVAMEQS